MARRTFRWAGAAGLLTLMVGCTASSAADQKLSPRDQAHVLLARGDARAAVPLLEALADASPDDLSLARSLAEAHVKAGSDGAFLKRLELSQTPVSHYQRGLVLFARAADASGPAIAEFLKAVELQPEQAEFHFRLGLALLESEKFEDALPPLTRAAALQPDHAAWALPLAKALYRTGQTRPAVAALQRFVQGAPTPSEVKLARALMNQIADPFAAFPRAARPTLEQGLQWLQVADVPQQAIVSFEQILADYPDLAVVHALLGLSYQRIDDAGRAVDELKRAIELSPDDGKNHLYLGELYLARQRPKQAEEHFRLALEKNPLLDEVWFHLGDLALERKDYAAARGSFRTACLLDPESVSAHGKLALVYQLDGDYPAAEKELKAVLEHDEGNVEFMLRLGILSTERWLKSKTPADRKAAGDEASKWLAKVLEQQPDNALASRALESIQSR